ncbi:hypothetical protein K488DRAFT_73241 [Vararia minispora EC-137]|uniref:Uncharacterized protein n=1 Tax=Vararia minispora EC-137 TaxID=1314806 RepID=A0ACB8QBD8_9AGAM|nr:hypothetical protein K488DRAFT_73241 [Vararia minispora EC-137]
MHLPPSSIPKHLGRLRTLHFGVGFKSDDFVNGRALGLYVKEHNQDEKAQPGTNCVAHLSDVCGHQLELIVPESYDWDFVISLYSNYDLLHDYWGEVKEKEVLGTIREALGDPEQEAMWYFNSVESFEHTKHRNHPLPSLPRGN